MYQNVGVFEDRPSDRKVLDTVYFQKRIKREHLAPEQERTGVPDLSNLE